MKILCTGAAGFIGSHLVEKLTLDGHEVIGLDNFSTGMRENIPKGIKVVQCDVTNWFDLLAEFVDFEPDVVIHLAAQSAISSSIKTPSNDAWHNVMGTLSVIKASEKLGVKRLIFSSTSAVYDVRSLGVLSELSRTDPNTPYGISKLAAESYVRNLFPESVVLRFGNVYGPRQVPIGENQVIPQMIKHFEKGNLFYIHGDGEQTRDFVYVYDVVRALCLAIDGDPGIYNIAGSNSISINKLAEALCEVYDVKDYQWQHDDQNDPRRFVSMSICEAKERLGWEPEIHILNGLNETVKWWKKSGKY